MLEKYFRYVFYIEYQIIWIIFNVLKISNRIFLMLRNKNFDRQGAPWVLWKFTGQDAFDQYNELNGIVRTINKPWLLIFFRWKC